MIVILFDIDPRILVLYEISECEFLIFNLFLHFIFLHKHILSQLFSFYFCKMYFLLFMYLYGIRPQCDINYKWIKAFADKSFK